MILLALSTPTIHACGVDDGPRYLAPVPRPVLSVGRFSQALLGHSCQAPKYLDEFHSFTTLHLANMLSELRKYRVNLILAHQYLSQLDPQVRDAILGNVGTLVSFRLGLADAEILEKEFAPELHALDLVSLPNYHIYLKLMIHDKAYRPVNSRMV